MTFITNKITHRKITIMLVTINFNTAIKVVNNLWGKYISFSVYL